MTCDGRDVIAENLHTLDMDIGDWMVFGGMGAYTMGSKTKFNGMEASDKVEVWRGEMVKDGLAQD